MFANRPELSLSEKQMRNMISDFIFANPRILDYCLELYALRNLKESIENNIADEYGETLVNNILYEISVNVKGGDE